MPSTYQRSLVKGIFWEFFSFIITTAIAYLYYGNLYLSIKFSLVLAAIKIVFFFIHERVWKNIKWGKYEIKNRK